MKNAFFLTIAVAVMTIFLLECQRRNQTINTSEDGFLKDSCLIVTYAYDTVECRYQLIVDSIGIKMADSVQKVFLSDMKKHGSIFFKCADLTADIVEDCRGKGFDVCDSTNHKLYRFEFGESAGWFNSSEISFEATKGYFRNRNAGSEFLKPSGPYLDWK